MTAANTIDGDSKWTVIGTLVRKDFRLFLVPTVGLLGLTATCYILGLVAYHYSDFSPGNRASDYLLNASVAGIVFVPMLAAVFAGDAIAGERRNRTADFLSVLPVTRRQIAISKWITSIFVLTVVLLFNLLVAMCALRSGLSRGYRYMFDGMQPEDFIPVAIWIGMFVLLYGIAWLLSTVTHSPPISACGAIGAAVVLPVLVGLSVKVGFLTVVVSAGSAHLTQVVVLGFWTQIPGVHDESQLAGLAIALFAILVGVTSLVCGTAYYFKRIAP